jgi:Kef-type K+ transport system membrane component KefB
MSLPNNDLVALFTALAIVLVTAHICGHVFARLRQPPVIGEILGGLLLGPTVLGHWAPGVAESLFPSDGPVRSGLQTLSEFGLLLLMFLAGRDVTRHSNPGRHRTVAAVTVAGLVIPMAVGVAVALPMNHELYSGERGTATTFALVFGIAIAVTSIPVISRIMLDLGILNTKFARVVLAVALLEDVVLYFALAVTLSMVEAGSGTEFGLASILQVQGAGVLLYHLVASVVALSVLILVGRKLFRRLANSRLNLVDRRSQTAFRLVFLLVMVLFFAFLGLNPIFGALLAGVASAEVAAPAIGDDREIMGESRAWEAMKQFSLAFFIPLYFAGVGMQLDLIKDFDIVFFVLFFLLATVVKASSVWAGARVVGESNSTAVNLAVALNARGGPGIVLATVTLSAGVINGTFFTAIVVLSIVTSLLAGVWLDRAFATRDGGAANMDDPVKDETRTEVR